MAEPEKMLTKTTNPPAAAQTVTTHPVTIDDDSDPDFDDLDDVLDQFSANAPSQPKPLTTQPPSQTIHSASGPGRPTTTHDEPPIPTGQKTDESEEEFITRLSKEMSTMLDTFAADQSSSTQSPEEIAKMGKELEEFTNRMEKEGIKPEDLLKAILGEGEGEKIAEMAHAEREKLEKTPSPSQEPASSPSSSAKPPPKSFEDTIRNTMSRLGESDKSATTATQKSSQKSEEDLLADMLRALDTGPSGSAQGEEGLSKMFMEMMQQLTHRDLLYEPMKELNDQYPSWLAAHKSKLDQAEYDRYSRQRVIVADITQKFEEKGFSDEDPKCREFIWEKMQAMQEEGAPPEELVKNPFPGTDFGGMPAGLGGGGEVPEGLEKDLEEGCPTQ